MVSVDHEMDNQGALALTKPNNVSRGKTNDHIDMIRARSRLVHVVACNKRGKAHTSQRFLRVRVSTHDRLNDRTRLEL